MENAMSDLTSEDKALLELARGGHEPTDRDRARVRIALLTRLGVGTGLVTTTAATSKAATTVLLTKFLATVAIASAVGGAGLATYRASRPDLPHRIAAPTPDVRGTLPHAPERTIVDEPVATTAVVEPETPREESPPAVAQQPSIDGPTRAQAPFGQAPHLIESMGRPQVGVASPLAGWPTESSSSPQPEPVSAPPDLSAAAAPPAVRLTATTLEAETRLVRAGVAALHAGNAARALALFDEHARAFPSGVLSQERAAERVVALGALHRCDDARAAAALFLRDHPHSLLAARVRGSCAGTSNP
jgi:hypothetical protein